MSYERPKRIVDIFKEEKSYYVKVEGDEDNFYMFEKTKFCDHPIMHFPVDIKGELAIPTEGYDAQIDLKYHLIKFKRVIDEDHIHIESVTTAGLYVITIKDLRPLFIR